MADFRNDTEIVRGIFSGEHEQFRDTRKVELRKLLRMGRAEAVNAALDVLLAGKPRRHEFDIAALRPAGDRHTLVLYGVAGSQTKTAKIRETALHLAATRASALKKS